MGARAACGALGIGLLGLGLAGDAAAQSLDEQLDFFLGDQCAALEFERDEQGFLLPGQASDALAAFCGGPPLVGNLPPGTTVTVSVSGGTGAAAAPCP